MAAKPTKAEPAKVDPLTLAAEVRDKSVLSMVEKALKRKDVLLAFQPVVQSRGSSDPAFYEGLIRVLDDTGRIIPARDFIEDVETDELGRIIDCLALELGLTELSAEPGLRLAINMSARSIGYPRWMETLERGLAASPMIAERLILEITESSAMVMPDIVRVFMAELQAKGISFALDDFGAGFTAFRHFKEFYFDILKIDGQFSRNIHADPDNQVLMQALVAVGRHFDMLTVAESVEEEADARFLTAAGVDCQQGYHYAAPTTTPAWRRASAAKSA